MLPSGSGSGAGSELVPGLRVSDGFFRTLGVAPVLGRDFFEGEDLPSAARTVMMSYAAWQRRFAGRKDVIGQAVNLSGVPYTVVGVLPASFQFAPRNNAEFFAPFHAMGSCDLRRSCHGLVGLGRLKDGVSVETANADFVQIAQQLERQYPDSNRDQGGSAISLSESFVGDTRPILLTLLGGAGLLLLIACVNVASLLLVRSESRRREIAVRGALGASRARLSRQFVTEGVLLVGTGSWLGLGAALGGMRLLLHLLSKDMLAHMPYFDGLGLNWRVMSFAAGVAIVAAIVFSVTPMLRLSGVNVREGLAEGSRGSAGVMWRRLGSHMVIAELAIAMVLLVSAGLLGKSFYRLLHVELGFVPEHVATLQVAMPELQYAKDTQQSALVERVVQQVSELPGVTAVATTSLLPVTGNGNTDWIRFVGRPYDGKHIEVNEREVSPGFFGTVQAKLLRGRAFTNDDGVGKPLVAVVNEAFSKKYYPGEDAIGKTYGNTDLAPKSIKQLVGVVEDVREASLDQETLPTEYEPFAQNPDTYFNLMVRTGQDEASVLPSIVAAIHGIDPALGMSDEATMALRISDSQTAYLHRSSAWLVGGFAALALVLGGDGIVWGDCVLGEPKDEGDWSEDSAGSAEEYGLRLDSAGGWVVDGVGCGGGAGVCGRGGEADAVTAVWDGGMGCGDFGGGGGRAGGGGDGGKLSSGKTRGGGESGGGVAGGVGAGGFQTKTSGSAVEYTSRWCDLSATR